MSCEKDSQKANNTNQEHGGSKICAKNQTIQMLTFPKEVVQYLSEAGLPADEELANRILDQFPCAKDPYRNERTLKNLLQFAKAMHETYPREPISNQIDCVIKAGSIEGIIHEANHHSSQLRRTLYRHPELCKEHSIMTCPACGNIVRRFSPEDHEIQCKLGEYYRIELELERLYEFRAEMGGEFGMTETNRRIGQLSAILNKVLAESETQIAKRKLALWNGKPLQPASDFRFSFKRGWNGNIAKDGSRYLTDGSLSLDSKAFKKPADEQKVRQTKNPYRLPTATDSELKETFEEAIAPPKNVEMLGCVSALENEYGVDIAFFEDDFHDRLAVPLHKLLLMQKYLDYDYIAYCDEINALVAVKNDRIVGTLHRLQMPEEPNG